MAGYTYSHALDDVSSTYQALIPSDSAHPAKQYGNTDFDIRHRLTLTATYNLPGKQGFAQLLEGWQFNSIVSLSSGAPWGPMDMSNDFSGTGDVNNNPTYGQRWDFFGNPSDFKAGRTPFDCWAGSGGAALGGCTLAGAGGTAPPAPCTNAALKVDGGVQGPAYASPSPPSAAIRERQLGPGSAPAGHLWHGRSQHLLRDLGYRGWDLSLIKGVKFNEAAHRPVSVGSLQRSQSSDVRESLGSVYVFGVQRSFGGYLGRVRLWLCHGGRSGFSESRAGVGR